MNSDDGSFAIEKTNTTNLASDTSYLIESSPPLFSSHLMPNPNLNLHQKHISPCTQINANMQRLLQKMLIKDRDKAVMPSADNLLANEHSAHFNQIELLKEMASAKKIDPLVQKKMIQFAEELLYQEEASLLNHEHPPAGELSSTLNELLYLVDNRPDAIGQSLRARSIHKAFQKEMENIQRRLNMLKEEQRQARLPFEISSLLFLSNGRFNTGIIPKILHTFMPEKVEIGTFSSTLKSGLHLLYQSEKLRQELEQAVLPEDLNAPGREVIRRVLQKEPEGELTNLDAKIAILSGFLTHLRQGKSGSCFASFIAIETQAMRPEETLKDLISLIEKGCLIRTVEGAEKQFPYLLRFGMQSEQELFHPLLRVWENAIAGMAEAKQGSILTSALLKSISYVFKQCYATHLKTEEEHAELTEGIFKWIAKKCLYLYDPSYTRNNREGQSGAFLLFVKEGRELKPIENSEAFLEMFQEISKVLAKDSPHLVQDKEIDPNLLLRKLLNKYHPNNQERLSLGSTFEKLRYTPWATLMGNDPVMTLKVYREYKEPLKKVEFHPDTALDLLKELHRYLMALPDELKKKYQDNQTHLAPVHISGQHAFSILLSSPSLKPYYKKYSSPLLLNPPLSKGMRKKMEEEILANLIPDEKKKEIETELKMIPRLKRLKEYRAALLQPLKSCCNSEKEYLTYRNHLDKILFKQLPQAKQKEAENSIVHFADSNWQLNGQEIHYGIGCNPASGEIELLTVLEDGTLHGFLNQNGYLRQHTWEAWLSSLE